MSHFDAYVESLLHFNLNFYLAFSPERGRTIGELVTVISSALARSGVACTANEVNQSIERRIAFNDGFVQTAHDKIWLNFAAIPATPMVPAPILVETPAISAAEPPLLANSQDVAVQSWEQQIWSTDFHAVAAALHDINAADFPIRLLVGAYSKLRNVASESFKEEYLQKLLAVLNNLVPGNGLNRLQKSLVSKLRSFGETSNQKVSLESSRIIALMRPWMGIS